MYNWDEIKKAVEIIQVGGIKRIDGDNWTAYAVGSNVIRVDLKNDE